MLILEGSFPDDQLLFLESIAHHFAVIQALLGRYERAEREATTDFLTRVRNRRFFETALQQELERGRQCTFALLMIDIDSFKTVNGSSEGHIAGDNLLRSLGDILLKKIRKYDVAARYGGDEFSLILSGADQGSALRRAESIRRAVGLLAPRPDGSPYSVSIGIAMFPNHGETAAQIVSAADLALMVAKEKGRNSVEVFNPSLLSFQQTEQ